MQQTVLIRAPADPVSLAQAFDFKSSSGLRKDPVSRPPQVVQPQAVQPQARKLMSCPLVSEIGPIGVGLGTLPDSRIGKPMTAIQSCHPILILTMRCQRLDLPMFVVLTGELTSLLGKT